MLQLRLSLEGETGCPSIPIGDNNIALRFLLPLKVSLRALRANKLKPYLTMRMLTYTIEYWWRLFLDGRMVDNL